MRMKTMMFIKGEVLIAGVDVSSSMGSCCHQFHAVTPWW